MARKKTGGKDWKPGQSGNPLGAAMHSKEVKRVRNLTKEQLAELGSVMLEGNTDKLEQIKDDPNVSVLQSWTAALILKSKERGDAQIYNAILDRIVGKVKEQHEHSGTVTLAELVTGSIEAEKK